MEEKREKTGGNKVERDKKGRILPGSCGNPNGRPEGTLSLVSILKKLLADVPEGEEETNAIILMKEAIKKAKGRDATMLRDIINRVDGMPKQSLEHTGKDEGPIQVSIVSYKDAKK